MTASRKSRVLCGAILIFCLITFVTVTQNPSYSIGQFNFPLHLSSDGFKMSNDGSNASISKIQNFRDLLLSFDWTGLAEATSHGGSERQMEELEQKQQDLITLLTPYVIMEPLVPVDESCTARPLTSPDEIKCEGQGNIFKGHLRSKPISKIGIMVQFGFGVDVLEIYLNEVYDVVDRFFILESTRAHFRSIKKSLIWERVKDQPRFKKFQDKIVHLLIDDAEAAHTRQIFKSSPNSNRIFEMEGLQERLRWAKFLQWNNAHNFFNQSDIIGLGDADEIPARELINMIRHCHFDVDRFDVGIWFSFGNVNYAFKTDWPVPGHPYTLGDPTFWTVEAATKYGQSVEPPSRMRGMSGDFVLGGMHMTHSGYLPFQLARRTSCSECRPFSSSDIDFFVTSLKNDDVAAIEAKLAEVPSDLVQRNKKLEYVSDMNEIAILPWFYSCNVNRYPSWQGNHDTRLD